MNETDYKQEGQKGEKSEKTHLAKEHYRRRHSGYGLLPPPDQTACSHHGSYSVLHPQPLCLSATNDRDRQTQERTDRY